MLSNKNVIKITILINIFTTMISNEKYDEKFLRSGLIWKFQNIFRASFSRSV